MSSTFTYYRRHLPHWQPPGATILLTWRLYGSLPRQALDRIAEERDHLEHVPAFPSETPADRAIRQGKRLLALTDELLAKNDAPLGRLADGRVAKMVVESFFFHAGRLYVLLAFVVMPNHVHLLLTPSLVEQLSKSQARKPDPQYSSQAGKPDPQHSCQARKPDPRYSSQAGKPDPQYSSQARKPDPRYVPLAKITQSLKGYTAREANRVLGQTGQPFWQDESYDHWARDEAEAVRIAAYIESDPVRSGIVSAPEDWPWSSASHRMRDRLVGQAF